MLTNEEKEFANNSLEAINKVLAPIKEGLASDNTLIQRRAFDMINEIAQVFAKTIQCQLEISEGIVKTMMAKMYGTNNSETH